MGAIDQQQTAAEREWLQAWLSGPSRTRHSTLPPQVGDAAPDLELPDTSGKRRRLGEFWRAKPALVLFLRHFGCSCLAERWEQLKSGRRPWQRGEDIRSRCCAIRTAAHINSTGCWRGHPRKSSTTSPGSPTTTRPARRCSPRGGVPSARWWTTPGSCPASSSPRPRDGSY